MHARPVRIVRCCTAPRSCALEFSRLLTLFSTALSRSSVCFWVMIARSSGRPGSVVDPRRTNHSPFLRVRFGSGHCRSLKNICGSGVARRNYDRTPSLARGCFKGDDVYLWHRGDIAFEQLFDGFWKFVGVQFGLRHTYYRLRLHFIDKETVVVIGVIVTICDGAYVCSHEICLLLRRTRLDFSLEVDFGGLVVRARSAPEGVLLIRCLSTAEWTAVVCHWATLRPYVEYLSGPNLSRQADFR